MRVMRMSMEARTYRVRAFFVSAGIALARMVNFRHG